ncbi:carbohydrate-binding protein [Microvirga sp. GCM10011540]|uniref:carbohydrate-binding protein n=1 Tax=Microvirga sp. GCM10011540 TaxID=3317338 RepID=UPI00361A5B49
MDDPALGAAGTVELTSATFTLPIKDVADTPAPVTPITIQAEDETKVTVADVGGPGTNPVGSAVTREVNQGAPDAFGNYRAGAMGDAYIDFGTNPGDRITFNVDAPAAGTYKVAIRYANGDGAQANRPLDLSVNSGAITSVAFPYTAPAAGGDAWEAWKIVEVEVELTAGTNQVALTMPAGSTNGPNIDQAVFTYLDGSGPTDPEPFSVTIEAETFTPQDTTGTGNQITQARTIENKEPNLPLLRDANNDGLWDNFTGAGYLDMGAQIGDAASFTVTAPEAGVYTFTFRYSNGGNPQGDRPMALTVGGETKTVSFPGTTVNGWDNWATATVEVALEAGANTVSIANTIANGPNIDNVTISRDGGSTDPGSEPGDRFAVKINFQPESFTNTPTGYVADTGLKFGDRSVTVDGKAYRYGWVTEASIADGTANGTTPVEIKNLIGGIAINDRTDEIAGLDPRQGTYAHLNHPSYTQGTNPPGNAGWEMELENGFYEVTVSIGDAAGPYDSNNVLRAEGAIFNDPFTPFRPAGFPAAPPNLNQDTRGFRSDLVTKIVEVKDGRLTLDAIGTGSSNTEIQYLEIKALPDLTPTDNQAAPADYAFFTNPRAISGAGSEIREVNLASTTPPAGVAPSADLVLGVSVVDGRGGALLESLTDGSIKLFETVTGQEVPFTVNTTAGFDSITISPTVDLKAFTSYSLKIEGFQDRGLNGDPTAPTREFQTFSTTFVTGEAEVATRKEVAFAQTEVNSGMAYMSIALSPDGSKLYVSTMQGEIKRFDVNSATGALSNEQTLHLSHFDDASGAGRRGIVGLVFDPSDPNTLWVSDNYPVPLSGTDTGVPDFSGRISKITLGTGSDFTGTATTYITGLPRSVGDHVTNSLEFRANPNAGQAGEPSHLLYLTQGSNSAMGQPDSQWGMRPERLLNASIMEIDPTRTAPAGGFDVTTEPLPTTGPNAGRRYADTDNNLKNGGIAITDGQYAGKFLHFDANGVASVRESNSATSTLIKEYYNPFAQDAVLKLFATGNRNSYDLVWHSNGSLYVPTNGSAAGGNVPDDPATSVNEARNNVGVQDDYLFKMSEDGYYGHPNPLRDKYILNGGNPTSGTDPNEVTSYTPGIQPDPDYVVADAMSLGRNRSPNGVIEYMSNVFGGNLQHNILFTEYSSGNGVRSITLDANGYRIADDVLRDVNGQPLTWIDPLDLIENPNTGQIYVMTLDRSNGQSKIIRLDPRPGGTVDPGGPGGPGDLTSIMTVQAEDVTPNDGTSVAIATGGGAQIAIRTSTNPEPNSTGPGYVNGLRPGAVGLDGNTNNTDGVAGGYADFGSTNTDFITFTVNLTAEQAGDTVLRVRYANGGTTDRPLDVLVNNVSVGTPTFSPPSGVTGDAAWSTWQTLDIPAKLVAGINTVTFRSIQNTGPNIDQLEILKNSGASDGTYVYYEAEAAQLVGAKIIPHAQSDRDAEGTGFVDFDGTGDQTITWNVDAIGPGTYELGFRYALVAGKGDRPLQLNVNGVDLPPVNFDDLSTADNDWLFKTVSVQLREGNNVVRVTAPNAVGPDMDQLRVTKDPVDTFVPSYAEINGTGRIELENGETAHTVNARTADFYFKVAADGLYALDLASNAGAPNGGSLGLFLNGQAIDTLVYPMPGTGEQTAYVELKSGTEYSLRVVSSADGANVLDYLDVRTAPTNVNADIAIQSLDPAFHDNRLHFSYLEDPNAVDPTAPDRDFKDSGTVRITNTGTQPLSVLDADITGPFVLANPAILNGLTLAAGQSIDVTVLFNRAAYTPPTTNIDATSTIFEGAIRLITNDAENPVSTIDLAGFWQSRDEGGQEPNVNEVWKIFGFGNVIENLTTRGGGENSTLSTNDVFAKTDPTEVLSPYWKLADGVTSAKITHIAAFHGTGGATIQIHNPNNKGQNVQFWNHEGTDNQRLLPNVGNDSTFATRTFTRNDIPDAWTGNDMFGISVAGLSSDPRLNPRGDVLVPGAQQGHTVKMFQALDANGNVIPNVYLGIMDYTGINYDYNDNMFVIEGVAPVGFGQSVVVRGLDDAAADERLVFTNIENPVNASQAFRNEATFTITNDGFAPLSIESITTANPAFQIVGTPPTSIAAGATANVTVRFVGTHQGTTAGADLYRSTLTIRSNDVNQPEKVIQLAGLAQEFSENNSEPTVAQIVEAFGYGTDVAQGELAGGGVVETIGDEVLLPYLQRLDATQPVEVIQIAAFLNQGNVARLGFHGLGSSQVTQLFANDDQQGQTVLPDQLLAGAGSGANVARATINHNNPFGLYISVDGRPTYASWSDPEANKIDPNFGHLVGDNQGHLIRFFQALDANGNVIEGTYIGIQDYPGAGNYDYNDHMFVIKNVKGYDLTPANDANNNDINDALELDADSDGTVNFFDPTTNPDPGGGLAKGDYVTGVNFGGGAIANDPVLGVALQAQSSISVTGSVNPAAGTDSASNPNGANAVAGSAFKTYEDGTSWNAAINVANGTYVVVLHTQETYWNQAGMRQFDMSVNGSLVANDLDVFAKVGGDKPYAVETLVTVTNGVISIALDSTGPDGIDNAALNAVTVYKYAGAGGGQTPFSGTPLQVGATTAAVTINATQFDFGGQGVAYNDTSPTTDEGGTAGRNEGVDIVGNNTAIGWIANGEWVEYTINVAQAGKYDLRFNAATPDPNRTITASFEQNGTFYATANPANVVDTNNYTSFTPTQPVQVDLKAGVQTVRLAFSGGSMDLQSFTIDRANIAPVVAQAVANQTATQGQSYNFALPATVFSDADGDTLTYTASGLPQGLSITPAGVISGTPSAAGTFAVTLTASDGAASAATTFNLTVAPPTSTQQPYGGTAPGFVNGSLTVDASNFDQGGQGVAYNDNAGKDGGTGFRPGDAVEFVGTQNDIGYVRPGEWVEYTVNVPQSGTYKLSLMAKTPLGNATVAVSLGGGAPLATVALQDGGTSFGNAPFQATAPVELTLPAGQQTIRLAFNGTPEGSSPYILDLRSFTFDYVPPPANQQAPFTGTAIAVGANPVVVDATKFDFGGQGVAYNDTSPTTDEGGTAGRNEGVDIVGNNTAIGWIANGEWVEYTINVAQAGTYDLSFLSALGAQGGSARSITATFEKGGTVYETATPVGVGFTGGWSSFQQTGKVQVDLEAGVQTVRLAFGGGSMDLKSFTLDKVDQAPVAAPLSGAQALSASFDGAAYLAANPDVAAAGMDPLDHYVRFGAAEGRSAPGLDPRHVVGREITDGFDSDFYLLNNPDVVAAGVEASFHFENHGWKEGRHANAFFDTGFYLESNPDVAAAGINALDHYLRFGAVEGRDPSTGFDSDFYLANNPDVAAAGINPLEHFLKFGISEGRKCHADMMARHSQEAPVAVVVLDEVGPRDPDGYLIG